MPTKKLTVHETVEDFKDAIGWFNNQIGPENVRRFRERIDDLYREALRHGIKLAAEIAKDYDKYSYHSHLVSECILGKLNVTKGHPHKNPWAAKIKEALDLLDRKVDSLEGTMRLMTMAGKTGTISEAFRSGFKEAKAQCIKIVDEWSRACHPRHSEKPIMRQRPEDRCWSHHSLKAAKRSIKRDVKAQKAD